MPITASCGHTLTEEEDLGTTVHSIIYDIPLGYGIQSGNYCTACADKMIHTDHCFLDEDECWAELQRYVEEYC